MLPALPCPGSWPLAPVRLRVGCHRGGEIPANPAGQLAGYRMLLPLRHFPVRDQQAEPHIRHLTLECGCLLPHRLQPSLNKHMPALSVEIRLARLRCNPRTSGVAFHPQITKRVDR